MVMRRVFMAVLAAALLVWAHRAYGWGGVAAVSGGLVMWLLLHVTRLMTVIRRAADRMEARSIVHHRTHWDDAQLVTRRSSSIESRRNEKTAIQDPRRRDGSRG